MKTRAIVLAATALVTMLAIVGALAPAAQSQIQVTTYVPVGVSASGSTSTAWFHEPSSRRALACQTVVQGTSVSSIQCVSVNLP